jgi:hypothetical protein
MLDLPKQLSLLLVHNLQGRTRGLGFSFAWAPFDAGSSIAANKTKTDQADPEVARESVHVLLKEFIGKKREKISYVCQ